MNIKPSQFCSLATSPAFQAWLYNFNIETYNTFVVSMQRSRNCVENQKIMEDLLLTIKTIDGGAGLEAFLADKYPYMLENAENIKRIAVFDNFIAGVLTYPHRTVLTGNVQDKLKKLRSGKCVFEYVIVGDTAYVEYLEDMETNVVSLIPEGNWLTRKYKSQMRKQQV